MAWKRALSRSWPSWRGSRPSAVACERSAESGGTVPPGSGLVTVTTAGTRPVGSVTWAVCRDVTSLDLVLSGEHRGLADVRIPAQADAGWRGGAGPG